jgi:replication factor C subunit 3/5
MYNKIIYNILYSFKLFKNILNNKTLMYCHKYVPHNLDDIKYHKRTCGLLKNIAKKKELHNMVFYGKEGTGKRTICYAFLKEIFNDQVHKLQTSSIKNGDKEIKYIHSNHHMEIDLSQYRGSEKILVHNFIKLYTSTNNVVTNYYKLIIFINAEKIDENTYFMLRRTIELTLHTTRYIFISKNLSIIPNAIISRLVAIRIPVITLNEGYSILEEICNKDNIECNNDNIKNIIQNSYDIKRYINIHNIINFLQLSYLDKKKYKKFIHTDHKDLNFLIKLIKKKPKTLPIYKKIREIIIDKYINMYPIYKLMSYINAKLLDDEHISDALKYKISECTAKKEYEMVLGNKDILYIESYIYELIYYFS